MRSVCFVMTCFHDPSFDVSLPFFFFLFIVCRLRCFSLSPVHLRIWVTAERISIGIPLWNRTGWRWNWLSTERFGVFSEVCRDITQQHSVWAKNFEVSDVLWTLSPYWSLWCILLDDDCVFSGVRIEMGLVDMASSGVTQRNFNHSSMFKCSST